MTMSLLEKSKLGLIEAEPDSCQEQVAAPWGQGGVVPCNELSTKRVSFAGEGEFRMCDQHAYHSVRNRRGVLV